MLGYQQFKIAKHINFSLKRVDYIVLGAVHNINVLKKISILMMNTVL